MVKPRCAPGVCFRDDMCIETANGVECAPCPDGYTGDGFNCDDVDEVKLNKTDSLYLFHLVRHFSFVQETEVNKLLNRVRVIMAAHSLIDPAGILSKQRNLIKKLQI